MSAQPGSAYEYAPNSAYRLTTPMTPAHSNAAETTSPTIPRVPVWRNRPPPLRRPPPVRARARRRNTPPPSACPAAANSTSQRPRNRSAETDAHPPERSPARPTVALARVQPAAAHVDGAALVRQCQRTPADAIARLNERERDLRLREAPPSADAGSGADHDHVEKRAHRVHLTRAPHSRRPRGNDNRLARRVLPRPRRFQAYPSVTWFARRCPTFCFRCITKTARPTSRRQRTIRALGQMRLARRS